MLWFCQVGHQEVKNPDVLLLPCGTTKNKVYNLYVETCADEQKMSFSSFCQTWNTFIPGVRIQKPRTDLCATCKNDTVSLQKLRSLDDEARTALLQSSLKHLELAAGQREHYKTAISQALNAIPKECHFGQAVDESVVQHLSFDFAQQVFIPNSSQQVGPLYFLVPYKVALFGVMCEPMGKMVIYIIPEAVLVSKGSNMVVSLLHHFLSKYCPGVVRMVLNADNCVGRNKNNTVLQYLMWRIGVGLSKEIELAFMVAGHTKFGPDYGFGVFKRLYRHSEVHSIQNICSLIQSSKLLLAEPVGTEQGESLIPCYDCQAKFNHLQKIQGLKQFHHFSFSENHQNISMVKHFAGSPASQITTGWDGNPELPQVIPPTGLPHARKEYLFHKIRPYVADNFKDQLCPQPQLPSAAEVSAPSPGTTAVPPAAKRSHAEMEEAKPVAQSVAAVSHKRASPTCGYCGEQGHRNAVRGGTFLCPKRSADSKTDAE